MEIQITRRHVEVPSEMQDIIHEKLGKIEKFYEKITSCHVILDSEHTDKTAEIVVSIMGGTLTARAKADKLLAAVESAVAKLERQLKKSNEKVKNHKSIRPEQA